MIGGRGLWSVSADNSKKHLIFEGEGGWRGYVRVRYEGEFYAHQDVRIYPRWIIEIKNDQELLISVMKKSAQIWKWPAKADKIFYSNDEVIQKINPPTQVGRWEIFKVQELNVYFSLVLKSLKKLKSIYHVICFLLSYQICVSFLTISLDIWIPNFLISKNCHENML